VKNNPASDFKWLETLIGIGGIVLTILLWVFPYEAIPQVYRPIANRIALLLLVIFVIITAWGIFGSRLKIKLKRLLRLALLDVLSEATFISDLRTGRATLGGIPNVALRLETVHAMLDGLLEQHPSNRIQLLCDIGDVVGVQFGHDFRNTILLPLSRQGIPLQETIDLWSKYDGAAGFGRFDFQSFNSELCTGVIKVHESFLATNRQHSAKCLCPFLGGYINGFLHTFTGKTLTVTTRCDTAEHPHCEFDVKIG